MTSLVIERSDSVAWYNHSIDEIPSDMCELLKGYSRIPLIQSLPHILDIVGTPNLTLDASSWVSLLQEPSNKHTTCFPTQSGSELIIPRLEIKGIPSLSLPMHRTVQVSQLDFETTSSLRRASGATETEGDIPRSRLLLRSRPATACSRRGVLRSALWP